MSARVSGTRLAAGTRELPNQLQEMRERWQDAKGGEV